VAVVEVSRSHGVDLITGQGLSEGLQGVDVVIDVSNPLPADDADVTSHLTTAYRNLVGACAIQGIQRLWSRRLPALRPVFDTFPYFVAKRAAEEIVRESLVPAPS